MPEGSNSAKGKAKAARAQDKLEAEYVRAYRIKAKSRATLIVCPLSTVANWEDQFREHWSGEVSIVGGAGSCIARPATPTPPVAIQGSQSCQNVPCELLTMADVKPEQMREGRPLRVYVYHGNARRPDPAFLADFDAVITTYATLASEFSKQSKSIANAEAEEDEEDANSDPGGVEYEEHGNLVIRLPKPKKSTLKRKKSSLAALGAETASALQSVYWFRVVLDEAQ